MIAKSAAKAKLQNYEEEVSNKSAKVDYFKNQFVDPNPIFSTKNKPSHGRESSNESKDNKPDPLDSERKGITKLADLLNGLDK